MSAEACVWREESHAWETSCGGAFTLEDGTPAKNDMRFCCFCGKPLKEEPYGEDDPE
jgi:hypothetical protein